MEEMLSQLIKSQDATAKSVENKIVENARALEAKMSALAQIHTSTDVKVSHIAYKQIEQIAEMSDLVDRISTVERSLQGRPNLEEFNSSGARLDGQCALHSSFDHSLVTCPGEIQNGQIVQSTTAYSCPFTQKLKATDETKIQVYIGLIVGF